MQTAVNEISRDAGILNFKTAHSAFFNQARRWSGDLNTSATDKQSVDVVLKETRVDPVNTVILAGAPNAEVRQAILRAGFQDISNALVGEFKLNYVLRIMLATMYRGLGFTRTLLFIRDHIPDWYRQRIAAQAFALFPIMIAKKPVGLIYGDAALAKSLKLEVDDLAQLKTLRNQAVLAIKTHSP